MKCPVCGNNVKDICNECGYNVENDYVLTHTVNRLSETEIDNYHKQITIHKKLYDKSKEPGADIEDLCEIGYYYYNDKKYAFHTFKHIRKGNFSKNYTRKQKQRKR